jgi:flagellar basal-body rod protein FlgB
MTLGDLSLFSGIGTKMDYLNKRQGIIAQNIANANTAGYIPQDLKPLDFGSALDKSTRARTISSPDRTSSMHLSGGSAGGSRLDSTTAQKATYDITPSGNAVVIEEQMMKAGETSMDYNLMTNLYQKHVSMIRMALGGN